MSGFINTPYVVKTLVVVVALSTASSFAKGPGGAHMGMSGSIGHFAPRPIAPIHLNQAFNPVYTPLTSSQFNGIGAANSHTGNLGQNLANLNTGKQFTGSPISSNVNGGIGMIKPPLPDDGNNSHVTLPSDLASRVQKIGIASGVNSGSATDQRKNNSGNVVANDGGPSDFPEVPEVPDGPIQSGGNSANDGSSGSPPQVIHHPSTDPPSPPPPPTSTPRTRGTAPSSPTTTNHTGITILNPPNGGLDPGGPPNVINPPGTGIDPGGPPNVITPPGSGSQPHLINPPGSQPPHLVNPPGPSIQPPYRGGPGGNLTLPVGTAAAGLDLSIEPTLPAEVIGAARAVHRPGIRRYSSGRRGQHAGKRRTAISPVLPQ